MEELYELQKQGLVVKALQERPKLNEKFRWLYEAYHLLSRSRQTSAVGEFFIPLTEYQAYLDLMKIQDTEQRLFLVSVISQVDSTLLIERYEKTTTK